MKGNEGELFPAWPPGKGLLASCSEQLSIEGKGPRGRVLGSNPGSATDEFCDLGQVTRAFSASSSSSVKWLSLHLRLDVRIKGASSHATLGPMPGTWGAFACWLSLAHQQTLVHLHLRPRGPRSRSLGDGRPAPTSHVVAAQ